MTSELNVAPELSLPIDAVTSTFGILAKKRAGKSNAAVVMAEEMWKVGVPWVAIDPKGDWWGLRSSRDGTKAGLPLVVFGGRHGDIPLEPTAGPMLADLILENRLTCVLDVSEFSKADVIRFLLAFADRLYRQAEADPLHLFLEEAHEYLPQRVMRDEARLVGAWQKIVKQGGFKGLGCTLISQRSASLNKDVLTQVDTLIVLRTTSPQDRAAVKAWVDVHDQSDHMMAELPSLADGEAWVWSPEFLGTLTKIRFRRRETFDSGATPKVGEVRRAPATLADVDLGAIKEAMADTIEKAKADDPKELRKRIAELERTMKTTELQVREVEVVREVIPAWLGDELEALYRRLNSDYTDQLADVTSMLDGIGRHQSEFGDITPPVKRPSVVEALRAMPREVKPEAALCAPMRDAPPLKAGARRILDTIARHHPMRLTKSQVGTLAKFKTSGGTFQAYKSALTTGGYVNIDAEGFWTATELGLDYADVPFAAPMSVEEIRDQWRSVLKAGARAMLDVLIGFYPKSISREELAITVDMTASGGTFSSYLSTLRSNGLAVVDGQFVTASDTLFMGGKS